MPIKRLDLWEIQMTHNTDPYGKAIVDVAREVMRILDMKASEDASSFNASDLVIQADKNIDAGGLTGFMAGAVSSIVSRVHSRGEEFRKSWNGDVGKNTGQEDSEGVLNPALLTIDSHSIMAGSSGGDK